VYPRGIWQKADNGIAVVGGGGEELNMKCYFSRVKELEHIEHTIPYCGRPPG